MGSNLVCHVDGAEGRVLRKEGESKRKLGRPNSRWEDYIEVDIKETGQKRVD